MSTNWGLIGGGLGAAAGGVGGFFVGGPVGAVAGAALGGEAGSSIANGLSGSGVPGTTNFTYNPALVGGQNGGNDLFAAAPAPSAGNYGQGDVWQNLQAELGLLGTNAQAIPGQSVSAAQLGQAPLALAAQGAAAQGTGAQGQAATGGPASWQAALGQAALGQASNVNASSVQAALGQATLARAAQMAAAQGGYAQAAPTQLSTAGDAQWQAQQQSLANMLSATAQGQGPSAADLQLAQGAQSNVASQLAALGSQRGNSGNFALTQRSAADAAAASNANLNQQMGVQRAQEALNAQNALGSVLGTARGQAQSYNLNAAQLGQQNQQYNATNAQQAQLQNAAFQQQAVQQNTTNAQQAVLANQAAQQASTGLDVGNLQQSNLANQSSFNTANEYNAGNAQNMTLANMQSENQLALANLAAQNAANQGNAQLGQQSNLANLSAENALTGQNLSNVQQSGMANLANAQQTGLANLANSQQTSLANQALLSQYAQQQAALQQQAELANQQYYGSMFNSLMSGEQGVANTDIAQEENANQLQAGIATNNAQAGANMFGAVAQGGSGLLAAGLNSQRYSNPYSAPTGTNTIYSGVNQTPGSTNYYPSAASLGVTGGTSTPIPDSLSDARAKRRVHDAADELEALFAICDENLKEGITGGNPMMASFLSQYRQSRGAPPGAGGPPQQGNGQESNQPSAPNAQSFDSELEALAQEWGPRAQQNSPQSINAGYGAPQGGAGPYFGGQNVAGQNSQGGTYGGGVASLGGATMGGYNAGGLVQNAGIDTMGGYNAGSYGPQGGVTPGGLTTAGGVTQAGGQVPPPRGGTPVTWYQPPETNVLSQTPELLASGNFTYAPSAISLPPTPTTPAQNILANQLTSPLQQPGLFGLPMLSDERVKEDVRRESYERGLRDALATKPGSVTTAYPMPFTNQTLSPKLVDAMRSIMADSAGPATQENGKKPSNEQVMESIRKLVARPDDARYGELGILPRGDSNAISTELSSTVTDPRLNGGLATNIPTLVRGQKDVHGMLTSDRVSDEQQEIAIQRALQRQQAGAYLPSYPSIDAAVQAARVRTADKGAGTAYTQDRFATMDPSVIQAVYGVKPNAAWQNATALPTPPMVASASPPGPALAMSDERVKEDVRRESYERGLRDALATKPGSVTTAYPMPFTNQTLSPKLVDAMRSIMADSSGAAPAKKGAKDEASSMSPDELEAALQHLAGPTMAPPQPLQRFGGFSGNRPRQTLSENGIQQDVMQNADPNVSPNGGYMNPADPMWRKLPGPGDYNPYATANGVNSGGVASPLDYAAMLEGQGQPSAPLSDERSKRDEESSDGDLADMLDQLHAYSYRYKDPSMPGASPGRKVGVMAQDLEKSRLGKSFVREGGDGYKRVDFGQMASTQLAATAYVNERLNDQQRMLDALTKRRGADA